MKNKAWLAMGLLSIVVLAGMAGCAGTPGQAQSPGPVSINMSGQQTGIFVNGQGKVTVAPDIAILTLGVSAQTATVGEAQTQAATAMTKVMAVLTSNGVAQKDIKTQNFSIQQVTRYDSKTQQNVIIGYMVSNMVVAKIRTLDKVGPIIDAATAAGGDLTRVNGIAFSVDQPEKYYSQAREIAMKDAEAKAQQMAKLSGVSLGRPTFISENTYMPGPVPLMKADVAAGVSAPTTPISPGETDITVNVTVTYAIQ